MKRIATGCLAALLSISSANATTVDPGLDRFVEYEDVGGNAFAEAVDGMPRRGGHASDWNAYNYARNNPLKYTDPTGEFPILLFPAAIAVGAGLGYSLTGNTPTSSTDPTLTPTGSLEPWLGPAAATVGGYGGALACQAGGRYLAGAAFGPGGFLNSNRYVRIGEGKFPSPGSKRISIGGGKGQKYEIGIDARTGQIRYKYPGQK